MERNRIKTLLGADTPVYGLVNRVADASVCEIVAQLGFDFMMVDTEHAPYSWHDVQARVIAGQSSNMNVLIRTASAHSHEIGLALDLGADGVHVPHVASLESARAACDAAYYRPLGTRGFALSHRAASYGGASAERVIEDQNLAVMPVLHIEDAVAVERIREIATIEHPAVLFVAPFDLTSDLGAPGDLGSPLLWDAYARVAAAAREHDAYCGTYIADFARLPELIDLGYRYFLVGSDVGALRQGATSIAEQRIR